MAFLDILILAARICQVVFSIIVLGCTAAIVNAWQGYYFFGPPSEVSFLLFVSIWSLLIVGYQILVPRYAEALSHKFIILGLDALTMIFWFAGFIAMAVDIGPVWDYGGYNGTSPLVHTAQAAAAFGAFAWISFLITTVLSALNIFRGNTSSKHNPEISHSVA